MKLVDEMVNDYRLEFLRGTCAVVFACALCGSIAMAWHTATGLGTQRWTETTGILQVTDAPRANGPTGRRLSYSYTVGEQSFEGARIGYRFPATLSDRDLERRDGQPVAVFYDPSHPERAVLERGIGLFNYAIFAAPVALLASVVLVVLRMSAGFIREPVRPPALERRPVV